MEIENLKIVYIICMDYELRIYFVNSANMRKIAAVTSKNFEKKNHTFFDFKFESEVFLMTITDISEKPIIHTSDYICPIIKAQWITPFFSFL